MKIFLFAGESSGDFLGGELIAALKQKSVSLEVIGVGGPYMQKEGLRSLYPIEKFEVMGFSDVLKALPRLYIAFKKVRELILTEAPDCVVFIDYADFNMRMAKSLRSKGFQGKLIHYVSPSVWAWRKKRIQTLTNTLDLLLTILPFEPQLFAHTPLKASYVGHPLIAAIHAHSYKSTWKEESNLSTSKPILALFPGSRSHEIARNLPIQWQVAQSFKDRYTIAISVAHPKLEKAIRSQVALDTPLIASHFRYELMQEASIALATSGTVTLELGLHATPTVITYRLSSLNYFLGRYLFRIRLPFYTLVNILSEKEVFPEWIHRKLSSAAIGASLNQLEHNKELCHQDCQQLHTLLTQRLASQEAAHSILNVWQL